MIAYRAFHNTDPPRIYRLWHECDLGRGAAQGFSRDALESLIFAELYFDKRGLIVACDGPNVVGYVHAGFGPNAEGTALSYESGTICAVMVHPDYRRRGIGRELIARAEAYLRSRGARDLFAGEASPRNPFYLGLYGGSESVGFLESDPHAAPFFTAIGYEPAERRLLFRRDITQRNEPFDPRLVTIRRKVQLAIMDRPAQVNWWWMTRQGRLDSICFALTPLAGGPPLAQLTCWGMDLLSLSWRQRTVGLVDLFVGESDRKKGYAKALLLEAIRRLRDELVTHIEVAALEGDVPAVSMVRKLGFEQIDAGVVYRRH